MFLRVIELFEMDKITVNFTKSKFLTLFKIIQKPNHEYN